jgi:Ser-tRNA(Ala) deacylase AlaX
LAKPQAGCALQGGLRVVEIEGVDINACGGTHLASLAEIQVRAPSGTQHQA